MKRNIFIKHKKYVDVCCLILQHYNVNGYFKLKIQWWNLGYVNSWCMGYNQNIKIEENDLHNWLWTEDNVPFLRNAD